MDKRALLFLAIGICSSIFAFGQKTTIPAKPAEKPAFAYLLATSDLDVKITVLNNQNSYTVRTTDELVKIGLDAGDNIIKVTPLDGGKDGYTVTKTADKPGNIAMQINLGQRRKALDLEQQQIKADSIIAAKMKADELAWQIAKTADTENAYNQYLIDWPNGVHWAVAQSSLRSLNTPTTLNDPIMGTMVLVRGGTYIRGCQNDTRDLPCIDEIEKPAHSVTLSDFYMGETEVTQSQWRRVMGTNPSNFSGCDQCPVEVVSWDDIQEFLMRLNKRINGEQYRLPTEAEWEYAVRGGHKSQGYKYSGSNNLDEVAWYSGNSGSKTHPVKGKKPNELGIYDMIGNVWEWCSDWYATYKSQSTTNPTGPPTGFDRVTRGCSYYEESHFCRPSMRWRESPDYKGYAIGFRVVRSTE